MAEKTDHSLIYAEGTLTVKGIRQVVEIDERQAVFKLEQKTLTLRGSGFNVVRLDREQGVAVLETTGVATITYRASGLSVKGLFR